MNPEYARQIRYGIQLARDVIAGKRRGPQLTPFGFKGAPPMPLWERAYHDEITAAVHDRRIQPPRGNAPGSSSATKKP